MGRLEVLAVTAGFLLILKAPALAQYTAAAPPVLASDDKDQSEVSVDNNQTQTSVAHEQNQTSAANDQNEGLADTDWWWQNDGLTVGYLGYGGACGGWSHANRAWQPYTVWWTGGNINPWSPAGSLGRFSNQSGWCNNYGYGNRSPYALWVNRILLPTKKHHHAWNHKSNTNSNNETRATAEQAPREGPDDDWTRVDDHIEYSHPQRTAALARQYHQGIRGLPHGPRSQNPQRARMERMQGLDRRHFVQARVLAPPHIGVARPAAHIAARSGGRGHS